MVDFGSDLRKRTLVLCAALALAITCSVLLRGRSRSMHVLFAAFAGDIALWYLAQALYGFFQASIWARFTALLAVLLPQLAILLFEAILPAPRGNNDKLRRVARVLAVPVIALVLSPYHVYGWARGIVFFYVFGLMVAALTSFAWRGRQSPSRATKARVRYLVVVGALAITFSLADFLWFIGAELPPVGSVLSVIFLFALAQSLGRERLLDLYELLGRLMVATALAFALAGIFYLCVTIIGRFSTMYLNAVLAAVVILVLYEPLRLKVEEKIHQIFFRERYGLETAVSAAQRRLTHTLEIEGMRAIVLDALESSRRATSAALYLRDTDGRTFSLSGAFGAKAPEQIELTAAHPLFERLAVNGSVVLEDLGREVSEGRSEDSEAERILASASVLGALRTGALLAIRGEGRELIGTLIVSDDRVRDAFSPEDVSLLESLAAQISVVLENSRVYARMKLRDRLTALGQMAAGLAHEIKNPLGAIKGAAQLLADPSPGAAPLDGNAREFIGIILEEVDRLDRVVGSVLDYARPAPDTPMLVDLNAIVRRTTQIVSSSQTADQELKLALEPDLGPARIDAEKLRQVLINLIQNGLQAMGDRGVVTISTRTRKAPPGWATGDEPGRQWLEISVADQGAGISKKVMKNLFVPFFTTKATGTGLGLAISQRIIQSAGGSIEVATQEGAGTTFTVLLPMASEQDEPLLERAPISVATMHSASSVSERG